MGQLYSIITASVIGLLGGLYIGIQLQKLESVTKKKNVKEENKFEVENKGTIKIGEEEHSNNNDSNDDSDNEEEEEEDIGIVVNSKSLNEIGGEVRMALIVRTDLGMLKGKIAAQCSHAAVSLYRQMNENNNSENFNKEMIRRWQAGGQAKITLKCSNIEEMEELLMKAVSLNINNYLVIDAGRTQIAPGSATVLGLGPAPKSILDLVTKELKLY
jgi:PTH2 family peptidyl-tRNA hydrolase